MDLQALRRCQATKGGLGPLVFTAPTEAWALVHCRVGRLAAGHGRQTHRIGRLGAWAASGDPVSCTRGVTTWTLLHSGTGRRHRHWAGAV